jgi:hypothetical protein
MKKYLGTALIILSVICLLVTIFLACWGILHPSQHPSEDRRRMEAVTSAIIVGMLVILESIVLVTGLCLRRPAKTKRDETANVHRKRRRFTLAIYLGASLGIAMLGSLAFLKYINIGPLWFLVCQPAILLQIGLGPLGLRLDQGLTSNVLLVSFHIAYFTVLLYPVYRIVTLDRATERPRIRRMKIILALFAGLHFLVVLFLAVVSKA